MAEAGSAACVDSLKVLADVELPKRVRRVLEHQMRVVTSDLGRTLQVVLQESALELGREARAEDDPQVQSALWGSVKRLRDDHAQWTTRFMSEFESELAGLRTPRMPHALEAPGAPALGLSLVDTAEMDEGTVLLRIAARCESRNSLTLQLLGYRYGVLAGKYAFDAEHLPVGPQALCLVLRNTCLAMLPVFDARQVVYRQFEKFAIPPYPALLDHLNLCLVDDGILPHLSFVPVRVREASATRSVSRTTPGNASDESGPPLALEIDIATDVDADALREQAVPQGLSDPPASPRTTAGADADTAFAGMDQSAQASEGGVAIDPARLETFGAMQVLLGRRRSLLAKLRASGNQQDERVREILTREEVLGTLRRLRKGNGKNGSLADIRQTVMAQARQLHGHGVALAEADNDAFELFDLFLSQLHRHLRGGSPGEVLTERLRLPLLQLVLRDQDFFVDPAHPARMLLDAVSLAGARWLAEDDMDPQWLGLLQRAVATVQEDPDASSDMFLVANHALQDGLHAAARKTEMAERRQGDAARGREKLDLARQRAAREIADLVGRRSLPRFHAILLDQAWADVLSLALLRGGEDSATWRELRSTTAAIVDASVATSAVAPDPAFILRIKEALGQVGYHGADAAAIARQLATGRVDDADLASRTELIVQIKSRTRLGEENASDAGSAQPPLSIAEQLAHAQLATLVEARWIDLLDPADDSVVRRRLAWVSPRSGHALLTNRRGQRVDGGNLDALARMLAGGRLRLVAEDLPPAAIAWQATVFALERIAGGNQFEGAAHER